MQEDTDALMSKHAAWWVKKHREKLLSHFADRNEHLSEEEPITIFMAGSPGAGKTETAKSIVINSRIRLIHIDADAIRSMIPGFIGANASLFQHAATIGVEKLYDHVLRYRQSAIIDTTFTPFEKVLTNVQRSIRKNRPVIIVYVYQDPLLAWKFTKARELVEGRRVPRTSFITQFMEAPVCVERIHALFPKFVTVRIIRKDLSMDRPQEYHEHVKKIDEKIETKYSRHDIDRIIL